MPGRSYRPPPNLPHPYPPHPTPPPPPPPPPTPIPPITHPVHVPLGPQIAAMRTRPPPITPVIHDLTKIRTQPAHARHAGEGVARRFQVDVRPVLVAAQQLRPAGAHGLEHGA